eukprot:jgi/Botrbrau1/14039/Bobra.0011s0005.1
MNKVPEASAAYADMLGNCDMLGKCEKFYEALMEQEKSVTLRVWATAGVCDDSCYNACKSTCGGAHTTQCMSSEDGKQCRHVPVSRNMTVREAFRLAEVCHNPGLVHVRLSCW